MDYILPSSTTYTIYSKSGCPYCSKVKKLLCESSQDPLIVDCDEYLIEDKPQFLKFIANLAGVEYNTFPIIFDRGVFIGGFAETKIYHDKKTAFL